MACCYRNCPAPGTYYTLRRTEPPHLIFAEAHDYYEFDAFLVRTLERTGTKRLGYCWMPDAIHLALTIGATPLAEVMRRVTYYCSQRIRSRTGAKARYVDSLPMMLQEPETHLPMLLRYIHCIPVIAGAADSADQYPYSSHRMYAAERQDKRAHAIALHAPVSYARLH